MIQYIIYIYIENKKIIKREVIHMHTYIYMFLTFITHINQENHV